MTATCVELHDFRGFYIVKVGRVGGADAHKYGIMPKGLNIFNSYHLHKGSLISKMVIVPSHKVFLGK